VGKVVQPLQSVNCHDSRAHYHVRQGPFTQLVGFGWFGSGRVLGLVGLATRVRPVSSVWFGYRGETCKLSLVLATYELVALGYSWVTEVQYHAL
jgi:hypothetical protein